MFALVSHLCALVQTDVTQRLAQGALAGENVGAYLINYKKNGNLFLNRTTIHPIFDSSSGDVVLFVSRLKQIGPSLCAEEESESDVRERPRKRMRVCLATPTSIMTEDA